MGSPGTMWIKKKTSVNAPSKVGKSSNNRWSR